jgi:hypothetical protein
MSALKQPTIRVVAIIAEGVPESDAKQLISYARANNKVRAKLYIFRPKCLSMGDHYKFVPFHFTSIKDHIHVGKFVK